MGPGPGAGRRLSKIYYFIWGAAAFWPTTPPPTVTPPIPHQHPPQSSICPVIDDIHAHTRAQPTLKHTQMHVQYCPPCDRHTHTPLILHRLFFCWSRQTTGLTYFSCLSPFTCLLHVPSFFLSFLLLLTVSLLLLCVSLAAGRSYGRLCVFLSCYFSCNNISLISSAG